MLDHTISQSQPNTRKIYIFAWFDLFVRRRNLDIFLMAFGIEKTLARILRPLLKEHWTPINEVRWVVSAGVLRFSEQIPLVFDTRPPKYTLSFTHALIFQDFVHVYIYTCIHMHTHIIKVGSPSYKLVYKPHEYYSNILHWFRRSLPKFDGCWMCFTHSVGHNSPSVVKLRFKDLSIDEEDWNGCFLMDYNRWHSMVDVPAVPACQVWWHRKGKMYVFKSCTHSKTKEDPRILWNPPIASKNVLVCWVEKKRTYVMPKHHHTHGEPQPDAGPKVGIPCSFAEDREWQISWDIQLFFFPIQ